MASEQGAAARVDAPRNDDIGVEQKLELFRLQAEIRDCEKRAYDLFLQNLIKVSVCFFGDGTTNIGAFHEALNFAAVWKLPVIFVCENNLYKEYTPIGDVTAVKHPAADRAAAYGLERILIDGNDADVVFRSAQAALAKARAGGRPSLIECLTYRHSGHSRADPGKYRPPGELEEWMKRDPLIIYRQRLKEFGVSDEKIEAIEAESKRKVEAATVACKASPPAPIKLLTADVYADGGWAWRN